MSDSLTDKQLQKMVPEGVPAPPLDAENPALVDAEKAYRTTVISAVLFCLAAIFIVMQTRGG